MKKKRFKQAAALALSLAMILGLMPAVTKPLVVQAVTTNTAPTASQFATKAELMTNYDLDASVQKKTVQKVIFGQNGAGAAQEWKIAGADPEIKGADGKVNNIVLFAATNLVSAVFNNATQPKSYNLDWNCTYASAPATVNANHYGGCDLRQTILDLQTNPSYFSLLEQEKMNATTITTKDTLSNTTYTTTDKLYAAYGDDVVGNDQYIRVGTNSASSLNSGLKIDRSNLGSSGYFWLRAPYGSSDSSALLAVPGTGVNHGPVDSTYGVVPAFDLNLSSVLFASAASAASSDGEVSTKTGDTANAFTLRYASSGSETAEISADYSAVSISGTTTGMYLVVQNSAGAYAKKLTSQTDSVSADDIAEISDFENCKVWLESTTDRVTTAKMATQAQAPTTYAVTVNSGNGGGDYAENAAVTITANTAPAGQHFKEWTGTDGLTFTSGSKTSATATFTMPASAVEVTATYENDAPTPDPTPTYKIIEGADGTWTTGADGTLSIRGDGAYSKFKEVKVDGTVVDASNYSVTEGSTIITFKADYLKTLSVGNHTFELVWTDGSVSTSFTIKETATNSPSHKDDVPQTGDTTPIIWLFILAVISGGTLVFLGKKKKSAE